MAAALALTCAAQAADLAGAHWIWSAPKAADSAPAGTACFRIGFDVTEQSPVQAAELIVTADNLYEAHLNGQFVGENATEPDLWNRPARFNVAELIKSGHNVLAIGAANTIAGPAGLIARLHVRLQDGQEVDVASGPDWRCATGEPANWRQPDCNDQAWGAARDAGAFGIGPWGTFAVPAAARAPGKRDAGPEAEPPPDYPWPEAIAFVGDDCSLYRPAGGTGTSRDSLTVTIFNPRHTRAFPEHDLPAPMKVGHKLLALRPAKPGVAPTVLLDAGAGALGSPSVSFDGQWIYVSMAAAGDAFFHIWKVPAAGGAPQRLTDGPFHDIDPAELPDGNLVFTSTRIGTFDEYHSPPSRALFTMNADGTGIRPLTHTFVFDNEPEVLADGRLLFIRSDNFFDRGKVETLLHAIYPDGTRGQTEFGLDLGPEYGNRLRAFDCGSPAPMPDGRVAYLTGSSIAIGRPGVPQQQLRHLRVAAGDVAALPDGRLLCTTERRASMNQAARGPGFNRIAIADPRQDDDRLVTVHSSAVNLHSPVYLGPRQRPPRLQPTIKTERRTGILYCQNARATRNTTAGWPHVRAIRVLAGLGLTTRSSHSYIVHAGSEVVELGTVPLLPDGSFAVEVPADTAIALQAVDAEGRSELNEMSWQYVRPGESRGCVGCHQPRPSAPPTSAPVMRAMQLPPVQLTDLRDGHRFRGNNAAVTGLMELQFDRYREVAGLNRHEESVASLVARLASTSAVARAAAANRLALLRDPAAAPALAPALRDTARDVRIAAAMALAACGTRASAEPLRAAERDADALVRQAAAVALENLTGVAETPSPDAARRGEPPASPGPDWSAIESNLVQRLGSVDRDVVRRAAVALGHTGTGDVARAALRDYLARERANNPYPQWRRGHQGDNARFNALSEANPRTLQAVARALGAMKDAAAVPLLAETLVQHAVPATGNLFLAEACAEALGGIGTPAAEEALLAAFAGLRDYPEFTSWYGDHSALMACHASPVHAFIAAALDAIGSTNAARIAPHLLRSLPTDPDRALMLANDDYEELTGRLLRRAGQERAVVETCLALLGDAAGVRAPDLEAALRHVHGSWAGNPGPEIRAAQVLSLACRDAAFAPRVRAALERYRRMPVSIPRVFDRGIPVVQELPVRNWVCFYLARALGEIGDPSSADALLATLRGTPPEFADGSPDPLGPGVMFLHNELTPCWRAASAWALGRLGDRRALPALLDTVGDLRNATDTRHAAAAALDALADAPARAAMEKLAADYPEVSTRRTLLGHL